MSLSKLREQRKLMKLLDRDLSNASVIIQKIDPKKWTRNNIELVNTNGVDKFAHHELSSNRKVALDLDCCEDFDESSSDTDAPQSPAAKKLSSTPIRKINLTEATKTPSQSHDNSGDVTMITCCPDVEMDNNVKENLTNRDSQNVPTTEKTDKSEKQTSKPPNRGETDYIPIQLYGPSSSKVYGFHPQNPTGAYNHSTQSEFETDPLFGFFHSIALTVKSFPRPMQLEMKKKVFEVVVEAEKRLIEES